jgi:hypothetical protein
MTAKNQCSGTQVLIEYTVPYQSKVFSPTSKGVVTYIAYALYHA